MTFSKRILCGIATTAIFAVSISNLAHAAAPALKPNEEIVKSKNGCGFVIDSSTPSAKYAREAFAKLTWGAACIDGLAMGEGILSSGVAIPGQPAMLPTTGWVWYGRLFGPTETRWENGRIQKNFSWEGKSVSYRTLDTSGATWSKVYSENSLVNDSETLVSTIWIANPAIFVTDLKTSKTQQVACPDANPKNCEPLWVQHAGPVIEHIKAFLAENEPKARARIAEMQPLLAQWKAKQPTGAVEKRQADATRAAAEENARASNKMKLERECWDKDNNAMNDWLTFQGPRSEGEARLSRTLKELYEGPCANHPNAANGLARANNLLQDAVKHRAEEDKDRGANEAYQKEQAARREQDRQQTRELLGQVAGAVASGSNSKERKQAVLDAMGRKSGAGSTSNGGASGGMRTSGGALRWPREGGIEQWAGFSRPNGCAPDRFYVEPLQKKLEAKLGMSLPFDEQRNFYSTPTVQSFIKNPQVLSIMQKDIDRFEGIINDAYRSAGSVLAVSSNPPPAPADIVKQIRSFQFDNLQCGNASASGARDQHFCGTALLLLDATNKIENSIQIACHMGIAGPTYEPTRYTPSQRGAVPPQQAKPLPPLQQSNSSSCGESGGPSWAKCLIDFCAKEGGTPKVGECVACTGIPGRNWTRCPAGSSGVSSQQ